MAREETKSLLTTTSNARDLGGYPTAKGGVTPCNRFLRSDAPLQISENDIAYLLENNITTIIDLRTEENIATSPSPFVELEQFHYYNCPIVEGSTIPASRAEVPISYIRIAEAKYMPKVFSHMANAPEGVLFHCSAGKDRTGVVSAILLSLAGVSRADIIENYMRTKEYNRERIEGARKKYPEEVIQIITPHEEYMGEFLDMFLEKYGSVEKYLEQIGLKKEEIDQINKKFREE